MGNVEIPKWLKGLPLAPEFRPTDTEFSDPIAYISKIEKEASAFGICKIIPPLPKPSKKYVFSNLNKSLTKCPELGSDVDMSKVCSSSKIGSVDSGTDGEATAVFTTRQQELGQSGKKLKVGAENPQLGLHKQVWQSGEIYTLEQFEAKSKAFAKSLLGSLTRFMPDDIPGVTSPMVYIGMLFSWFAWHVEDHELHSLNFLHTGSSKTWYAVPADYALAFEEAIRTEAYGGNIDHLAALSLLGEKTTLLSPELVIASGIPCCRLVQNAGEFVVTFPRAYHVGFSHGFNCGEAANFGTPRWLQVAKEAAVRRAAMNHLPMLSHQQLLYVLTMSFISRVPRSLLPGARNSRLKDRQKEERELLVKKAFIEDMLNENILLSVLLGRGSTCRAVIWDPDLLPYLRKDSEYPSGNPAVSTLEQEDVSNFHSENSNQNNLLDEMSLYMESLNDLCLYDDDLSCDFQLDSGTLACVACGILGYPFMSVVQPSERASMELQSGDYLSLEGPILSEANTSHSHPDVACTFEGLVSDSLPTKDDTLPTVTRLHEGWNTSQKYLRPRIFCLEHAVQIEELMQSKGRVNIMVICHSDYPKIKAHAAAVAEEIGSTFNYNDIPLDTALEEDLNLISIAINDEEHAECGEDWTSTLGINLRYCIKVRKNSPCKQIQHALPLGGLFSERSCSSDLSHIKWKSRRSRSKAKLDHPSRSKHCNSVELKEYVASADKVDCNIIKKEQKIIQYSRRKKSKPDCSTGAGEDLGCSKKDLAREDTAAKCEFSDKQGRILKVTSPVNRTSTSHFVDSPATANLIAGNLERSGNQILEANASNLAACNSSEQELEIKVTDRTSEKHELPFGYKFSTSYTIAAKKGLLETVRISCEAGNKVSEGQCEGLPSRNMLADKVYCPSNSVALLVSSSSAARADAQLEDVENSCVNGGVYDVITSDTELQQEIKATIQGNSRENISCDNKPLDKLNSSPKCESSEDLTKIYSANDLSNDLSLEDKVQETSRTATGIKMEPVLSSVTPMNCTDSVLMGKSLNVRKEAHAVADSFSGLTSENKVTPQEIQTTDASKHETHSSSVAQTAVDQPLTLSLEEFYTAPNRICAEELHMHEALSIEVQQEIRDAKRTIMDEVVSGSYMQLKQKQPSPRLAEASSEVLMETCAREMLSADPTSNNDRCEKDLPAEEINEEQSVSSRVTPINKPAPNPIQKYSRIRKEKCATENMHKGSEASSSPDGRENGNIEPAVEDGILGASNERKRKREVEEKGEKMFSNNGFIRSPCEGLRARARKNAAAVVDDSDTMQRKPTTREAREPCRRKKTNAKTVRKESYSCDIENCRLSFETKEELRFHKRNRCPHEGCGKKFRSHKYAVLHQRVHEDDRPLKCPWKGCSMSFKWAWARTEHIRVHTGEKPYQCKVEGCGLSFRFVSDFSRHRRKTGHYVNSSS
ncbi:hypothetical protein SLEP1_g42558 [Rubroshorea leprosula]|uniref:Lysine-specific demethylase ELF6 n=1 Tax=Rubroshorea leprosula TaxID=152421 RepID=A0AAV5LB59_9ROSI|nr:hypothetical protein SLEP1_g42558 [Rubroshorea leprosula]